MDSAIYWVLMSTLECLEDHHDVLTFIWNLWWEHADKYLFRKWSPKKWSCANSIIPAWWQLVPRAGEIGCSRIFWGRYPESCTIFGLSGWRTRKSDNKTLRLSDFYFVACVAPISRIMMLYHEVNFMGYTTAQILHATRAEAVASVQWATLQHRSTEWMIYNLRQCP